MCGVAAAEQYVLLSGTVHGGARECLALGVVGVDVWLSPLDGAIAMGANVADQSEAGPADDTTVAAACAASITATPDHE